MPSANAMPREPELVTRGYVAALLSISPRTASRKLAEWEADGLVHGLGYGKGRRWRRREVIQALNHMDAVSA